MRRGAPEVATTTRRDLRRLTERLLCEYAGAVPAGRVARAVVEASRLVQRRGMDGRAVVVMTEQVARRGLTDEIARASIGTVPADTGDGAAPAVEVGRLHLPGQGEIGRLAS